MSRPSLFPTQQLPTPNLGRAQAQASYAVFIFSLSLLVNMLDAMGQRLHCLNLLQ